MGTRLNAPNQFETLSPPWILANLDTNFVQNKAAWDDASFGFVNGVCVDTGVANAYVVTAGNLPFGAPSAYNPGMTIFINPANGNTGASTIAVGALGTTAILNPGGNALTGGEISANKRLGLVYSNVAPVGFYIIGTCSRSFQQNNPGNFTLDCAGCTSVSVYVGYTITTSTGVVLSHLAAGVPVSITFVNGSGTNNAYSIQANDPAGTNYVSISVQFSSSITGGLSTVLQSGATVNAQTLNIGQAFTYTGVTGYSGGGTLYLSP